MCMIFECSEEIVFGIVLVVIFRRVRNVFCMSDFVFGGINLYFDSFINFDVF